MVLLVRVYKPHVGCVHFVPDCLNCSCAHEPLVKRRSERQLQHNAGSDRELSLERCICRCLFCLCFFWGGVQVVFRDSAFRAALQTEKNVLRLTNSSSPNPLPQTLFPPFLRLHEFICGLPLVKEARYML